MRRIAIKATARRSKRAHDADLGGVAGAAVGIPSGQESGAPAGCRAARRLKHPRTATPSWSRAHHDAAAQRAVTSKRSSQHRGPEGDEHGDERGTPRTPPVHRLRRPCRLRAGVQLDQAQPREARRPASLRAHTVVPAPRRVIAATDRQRQSRPFPTVVGPNGPRAGMAPSDQSRPGGNRLATSRVATRTMPAARGSRPTPPRRRRGAPTARRSCPARRGWRW